MKFTFKDFVALFIISLVFGFFMLTAFEKIIERKNKLTSIKYQKKEEIKEQIKYLRDSLEMEYYRKQLETYPFEHSKIPK